MNGLYARFGKCLVDRGTAAFLLILLSPLFLAAALAIRLDSPGRVFFRQRRVGHLGIHFEIFKFRSMVDGADEQGPYYTREGDSRVTRMGRFLRKTSLDEVPQLINIVRGEMSLIGPRPDVPAQQGLYTEREFNARHSVRPGITGLAQSRIRHGGTMAQRTRYDIFYARNVNLLLDLRIAYWTVGAVLRGSY